MTKQHTFSRMGSIGLVLLALIASLAVTTHIVSVSHAIDHVSLTQYSQYPRSIVGKIFIYFSSHAYECSGTVLISTNENLVDTAAHCFYDDHGQLAKANQLDFCPQYHDGISPYGCWTGKRIFISSAYKWLQPAHVTVASGINDYGFFVVAPQIEKNGSTRNLESVVGGALYSKEAKEEQVTVYGYPSVSPYTGKEMYSVTEKIVILSEEPGKLLRLPNGDLQKGASGGPWFLVINGITFLIGHTAVSAAPNTYSPIFNDTWESLFSTAEQPE